MKKIVVIVMIMLVPCMMMAQTLPDTTVMSDGLNEFSTALFDTVPNSSTQVGVWPDAWIGKFFPSVPPHFGVGASAGFTELDAAGLIKAADEINIPIDIPETLYLPTIALDARIGGILLPFDIGVSFLTLDNITLLDAITIDYLVLGASLRYALFQGNLILPQVSVGAGYVYNKTTIGASAVGANVSTGFESHTMYVEAQVSKNLFLFITPYVGARVLFSESENTWEWSASALGMTTGDTGTQTQGFDDPRVQLNAGSSFNFLIAQFSVGVSYDVVSEILNANTSLRVKL